MAGSAPGAFRGILEERLSASAMADAYLAKMDTTNKTDEVKQAQIEAMKRHVWANPGAVLCIRNIPKNLKKENLEAYFGKFGEVKEMRLPVNRLDPKARSHRGMCMLTYSDPNHFFHVLGMAQQTPHVIEGHKVHTTVLTPSEIRMEGEKPLIQKVAVSPQQPPYMGFGTNTFRRVFVSKVTVDIDDREFHSYFSQFGDVEVVSRPHGGNLGVGFVNFKHVEPAMIVVALRDHCIDGRWVVAGESQDGPGPVPGQPPPPLKERGERAEEEDKGNKAISDRSQTNRQRLKDIVDRSDKRDRSRDRDRDRNRDGSDRSTHQRTRGVAAGESEIARESKRRDFDAAGW